MNIVCYLGYLPWSAWGTRHCNLVILVRNRINRVYVVVVIMSWLSGVLCYHGYKPACGPPSVGRGFGGRAAAQQIYYNIIIYIYYDLFFLKTSDCSFNMSILQDTDWLGGVAAIYITSQKSGHTFSFNVFFFIFLTITFVKCLALLMGLGPSVVLCRSQVGTQLTALFDNC